MGATEWGYVALQPRDLAKQCVRRRAREQGGKQCIFPHAGSIDGIESIILHSWLAVEIGAKLLARHAGRGFDGDYPLGRHPVPIRNRRLGNADLPGKLGYAARSIDGTIKARIAHVDLPSKVSEALDYFLFFGQPTLDFGRGPVN